MKYKQKITRFFSQCHGLFSEIYEMIIMRLKAQEKKKRRLFNENISRNNKILEYYSSYCKKVFENPIGNAHQLVVAIAICIKVVDCFN